MPRKINILITDQYILDRLEKLIADWKTKFGIKIPRAQLVRVILKKFFKDLDK